MFLMHWQKKQNKTQQNMGAFYNFIENISNQQV